MNSNLKSKTIVLLGVGHTNAHIVRMWKMKPIRDCRLVCVSNFHNVTYSGMLPGVLSGQYAQEQMEIDLVRLCGSVGARLIVDSVVEVDPVNQLLKFADRPDLFFDALSIGIGSRPSTDGVEIAENANLVRIKPMQTFLNRLQASLADAQTRKGGDPIKVFVVGGGVGGIEVTFCLNRRLAEQLGAGKYQLTIVDGSDTLGSGLLPRTQRIVAREMQAAGVTVRTSTRVTRVAESRLEFDQGDPQDYDLVLWATNARASEFLAQIDLPHDDRGFLLTRPTLQSIGNDRVFAVGDSGTLQEDPTPKAGVYAVRQGPILWKNLRRLVEQQPLVEYKPQRGFLKLLNLSDGRAIGEYRGLAMANRAMWKLKDFIDVKFMLKHQEYEPMEMDAAPTPEEAASMMRCVGCGGKVGGSVLSKVLHDLHIEPHEDVLLGLDQPDDAAIVRASDGQLTLTTDFFAAPFDDPWLVGRLAALNSASDAFAMGAQPTAALANIQIPYGQPRRQQQELYELLCGAQQEFAAMGATIAGGHTIEGPRLTVGFTVAGKQVHDAAKKSNLHHGDQLILTKPIGSGIMLAALMKCLCPSDDFSKLVKQLLLSNQIALKLIDNPQVSAVTDVTGFGLAGHLLEMLRASEVRAEIQLDQIRLFDGVADLIKDEQVESTLAIHNREVEEQITVGPDATDRVAYQTLFDPQTCGGLLLGVSGNGQQLVDMLHNDGFSAAAVIGRVMGECPAAELERLAIS